MIHAICAAISATLITLISVYLSDFKFKIKTDKLFTLLAAVLFGVIYFGCELFNLPFLVPLSFFMLNLFFNVFMCKAKFVSALFPSLSLAVILALCRALPYFLFSGIFEISCTDYQSSPLMVTMSSVIGVSLFLATVYIITRFADKGTQECKEISYSLLLMPLATGFTSLLFVYISNEYEFSDLIKLIISVSCLLLLISNSVAFYVHEVSIKNCRYADNIKNENQQLKNREEYYSQLREQNESSRVLMHDISKHLNTIGQISRTDESVTDYISSISNDFGVTNPIDYSSNPTLNLITHRFYEKCKANSIRFDVNIREAKIDFMTAPDITALFDNMLENAFEAANISNEKLIDFSVYIRNKNFVIIQLINSCSVRPEYSNGEFITHKKSPLHGIGTRSIKRVVKKYDGDIKMQFNEKDGTFEVTIMLRHNVN